jgi:hypothetical protein
LQNETRVIVTEEEVTEDGGDATSSQDTLFVDLTSQTSQRGDEEDTEQGSFLLILFYKLPPYPIEGFGLTTHSSSLLGGRQR